MGNVMMSMAERPETEVNAKAKRRRFTAEYRQRILREAAACTQRGEVGALLRREGLYSSHLTIWRQQADQAQREALKPKKRGPKPKATDERDKRIAQLERDNAKLAHRAERAEALVEVQKKVSQLLGIALPTPPHDPEES
jgi:transposase-like protein